MPDETVVQATPVPVQQVMNILQHWDNMAQGVQARPPYEELWLSAQGDIRVLGNYALGQVQAAWSAGYELRQHEQAAHALMLRALDGLYDAKREAQVAQAADEARLAGGAPVAGEALDIIGAACDRALELRERALAEIAKGRVASENLMVVPDLAARQAAALGHTVATPEAGRQPVGPGTRTPAPTVDDRVQASPHTPGEVAPLFDPDQLP